MAQNVTTTVWSSKVINSRGDILHTLAITSLPGDTTALTTKNIPLRHGPDMTRVNRYISVVMVASAVAGTNLDIALQGAMDTSLTGEFTLLDAVVADITNSAKTKGGVVDLNVYPAPVYAFNITADTDNLANGLTIYVYEPAS